MKNKTEGSPAIVCFEGDRSVDGLMEEDPVAFRKCLYSRLFGGLDKQPAPIAGDIED